jgi:hypothetical protein
MTDPLDRATSHAPPLLGEGCTARYDPQALTDDNGTDFPHAEALWKALQEERHAPLMPDEAP